MSAPTTIPVLDAGLLEGGERRRRRFAAELRDACRRVGFFYLADHPVPLPLCREVLDGARAFFDLPAGEKAALHIRRSAHFRGYSEMKNERDWREQVHLGLELPAAPADGPAYDRLQGPNLWPASLGAAWRTTMLSYLREVDALGRRVLAALALSLRLPEESFADPAHDTPYLLLKLICYHTQRADEALRVGVAPHCDWSWLTFLLQDDTGGLQAQGEGGAWLDVRPLPGTLAVNLGELTEFATAGCLRATPHRVCNVSCRSPRLSVPVFVNPDLRSTVAPLSLPAEYGPRPPAGAGADGGPGHIHRVLDPHGPARSFVFGESEWRRKGLGRWCYDPACVDGSEG
jgi:isopenicillin N synthase-like dioxygenase